MAADLHLPFGSTLANCCHDDWFRCDKSVTAAKTDQSSRSEQKEKRFVFNLLDGGRDRD